MTIRHWLRGISKVLQRTEAGRRCGRFSLRRKRYFIPASYLLNSGIFVIDDKEDLELFLLRSNFIIEASKGSIRNVLNELEEDFSYSIKNIAGGFLLLQIYYQYFLF